MGFCISLLKATGEKKARASRTFSNLRKISTTGS